MILTCPECSTNYMAKDGSIGPNGRTVRCARCETVWFVEGADPDALALEDIKTVLITEEPEAQAELPFDPQVSVPQTVGAHTLLRNKADAEKLSKHNRMIKLIWAVPVFALIAAAAVIVLKRQAIVEDHPKAATLYQTFGMDVKANGLDVIALTSQRLLVDGESVLRVTGEIVNLTPQAKSSPLLQLRLENRSGEPLANWFVEPGVIPGGGSVKVETDYPVPPIDSVELRYRFAPED